MANRVVNDDILTSEEVDSLSLGAEVFYRRLLSVVDDYGRFDGRHLILAGRLYPLRFDDVKDEIGSWLDECVAATLVLAYRVDGKPYVQVRDIEAPRAKTSRCPPPPDRPTDAVAWPDRAAKSFVYFIHDTASDAVKIGSSLCPLSRLCELQTSNPNPLRLLGVKPGGRPQEKEYHRQFDAQRIRSNGEWFRVAGELLEFLRAEGFVNG